MSCVFAQITPPLVSYTGKAVVVKLRCLIKFIWKRITVFKGCGALINNSCDVERKAFRASVRRTTAIVSARSRKLLHTKAFGLFYEWTSK